MEQLLPRRFRIVETDNYGGDYPNEKFLNLPKMIKDDAIRLCQLINDIHCRNDGPRYWMVVEGEYELQPGFEP